MSRPVRYRPKAVLRVPLAALAWGLGGLGLLAACTTAKPPAPPPPPLPQPAVVQTDIILGSADEAALQLAMDKLSMAQPNQSIAWTSPESGLTGAVKVLRDGFDEQNRPCREFHSVITRQNLYKHATGFLCQQSAGSWEVVDIRTYPIFTLGGL